MMPSVGEEDELQKPSSSSEPSNDAYMEFFDAKDFPGYRAMTRAQQGYSQQIDESDGFDVDDFGDDLLNADDDCQGRRYMYFSGFN